MIYQGILWAITVCSIVTLGALMTNGIVVLVKIKKIISEIDAATEEIGIAIRERVDGTKNVIRTIDLFDTMLRHAMFRYTNDNPMDALFHPFHSYRIVAMDTIILFKVEHPNLFT